MAKATGSHWSNYWSEGNLTSLPADFQVNYDGEIKAFWFNQFERLAEKSVVLDVCSGNGAVALLAAEYASESGKDLQILATDGAKINAQSVSSRFPHLSELVNKIKFIDQVTLEELTLEPSSLDMITSQYGVEYTEWSLSSEQFKAWLKPGGVLVVVAHSRDTDIIAMMKNEYKEYQVLAPTEFFKRAKKVLRHNPAQKELQGLLRPVGEELAKSLLTRVSPVLKSMMEAAQFVHRANAEQFRQNKASLIGFLNNILLAKARLDNLIDLHKRLDENPQWYQAFIDSGFELKGDGHIVYKKKHPAGDYFVFQKTE